MYTITYWAPNRCEHNTIYTAGTLVLVIGGSRVGPRGARPSSPLIFRPNRGPKKNKKFGDQDPPPLSKGLD